jgi:hypothetical protein
VRCRIPRANEVTKVRMNNDVCRHARCMNL